MPISLGKFVHFGENFLWKVPPSLRFKCIISRMLLLLTTKLLLVLFTEWFLEANLKELKLLTFSKLWLHGVLATTKATTSTPPLWWKNQALASLQPIRKLNSNTWCPFFCIENSIIPFKLTLLYVSKVFKFSVSIQKFPSYFWKSGNPNISRTPSPLIGINGNKNENFSETKKFTKTNQNWEREKF